MGNAAPAAPLVTVLTPVFNGERYLAEAIESVLAQTFRGFEYIIVNDGSTDASEAIAQCYAARDPRIKVLSHPNIGAAGAMNRGLAAASGTWVAILDHDDVCAPTRIERQLRAAQAQSQIAVWGSFAWRVGPRRQRLRLLRVGPTSGQEFRRLRDHDEIVPLIHPTAFLHRETILQLGGYDAAFRGAEDIELWSRVADAYAIQVIPEALLDYRMHDTSFSSTQVLKLERAHRWILARQRARRAGAPIPSYAEFRAREHAEPWLRRTVRRRYERSVVARRRAQLEWLVGRRVRAVGYGCVSFAYHPSSVINRLRQPLIGAGYKP
jgi:glycosyltransferase involved in cell wall biosynthesis